MATAFLRRLVRVPVLGRALLLGFRLKSGLSYASAPVRHFFVWLVTSREYTNYTYGLSEINRRYLAAFVAQVTPASYAEALAYIEELEADTDLKEHVRRTVQERDERRFADRDVQYGRRLGWYAIVRAVKPRVVVETGVDKGLGACVLTAALLRNAQEGREGRYYGTDINPAAGYLLGGAYAHVGRVLYGDSIQSLERLDETIDVFINDSDHSAAYEEAEYRAVRHKLSDTALLIGDNAHATDKLLDFALQTGRTFLFFKEQPAKHWYPGGGIGVAFKRA